MQLLSIHNPFNALVYHEDTVNSTMEVSRTLARSGEPHGTVIAADYQSAGRGRLRERAWHAEKGENLAITILLRFPCIEDIPPALPLRTGLAVSLAIEDFAPALGGRVLIKWPNDVLIQTAQAAPWADVARKAAGILIEADGGDVHIGIGVNVAQKQFPEPLRDKATSISIATGREIADGERYVLLEKILLRIHAEIETAGNLWRERIEARLHQKGQYVCFADGSADSGKTVTGILSGIGPNGELLLLLDNCSETASFTTGELRLI